MTRESLLVAVGGRADLLTRMAAICLEEDAPRLLAQLQHAVDGDDRDELQEAAHALRGMAGAFGADEICSKAASIETEAHRLSSGDVRTRVAELFHALEPLLQVLREIADRAGR